MTEMLPSVALLSGGLATRLRPLTETIPKALVEIAGKPFISHQLELLQGRGIRHIVLCVGYLGEKIRQTVGDGRAYGLRIDYSFDGPRLLGTAGALKKALPLLGVEFFVLYGDSYLDCDHRAIYKAFCASGQPGLMAVFRNDDQWNRSNVIFRDSHIVTYDKRNHDPAMCYIDYGIGLLRGSVFDGVSSNAPADLADVYQRLAQRGQLAGYEVYSRFYEIGSPQGLEETRRYLQKRT